MAMSSKIFTAIDKIGVATWTYTWAGTPPFRVFVDGDLYDGNYTPLTLTVYGDNADEPPVVEVCEDGETVESESYPVRGVLQWFGNPDAHHYNVYIGATYKTSQLEDGRGYYQYPLPKYVTGTDVAATVKQVDEAGNESASVAFQLLIFKYPDPPDIDYSYVALTGTFTAAAGA